jgi:hypothetical protein
MSVASWSGSLLAWEQELTALKDRIGLCVRRRELRTSIGHYLDGLLSGVERKTGWLLAERAGEARPHRLQAVLGRGRWDTDAARDLVRAYAVEALADPDAVLVVDETGFLKKGTHSVGVARQYSGTAGRIENCQIGVFLAYASRYGQALIDRRLFLPEAWAADHTRRAKAGVPEAVAFATKPTIARELIAAALDAGLSCAFVLADALYGSDKRLRMMLEARAQPYVLAVRIVVLAHHCGEHVRYPRSDNFKPRSFSHATAHRAHQKRLLSRAARPPLHRRARRDRGLPAPRIHVLAPSLSRRERHRCCLQRERRAAR